MEYMYLLLGLVWGFVGGIYFGEKRISKIWHRKVEEYIKITDRILKKYGHSNII